MANKRRAIRFEELEPRGKAAILRSADEINSEQAVLENNLSGTLASQHSGKQAFQNSGGHVRGASGRAAYTKATYRLSTEALEGIDEAKRILRRNYGIKVTLEEIAEEAILMSLRDLNKNQQASILVNKFSGNQDNQNSGE